MHLTVGPKAVLQTGQNEIEFLLPTFKMTQPRMTPALEGVFTWQHFGSQDRHKGPHVVGLVCAFDFKHTRIHHRVPACSHMLTPK